MLESLCATHDLKRGLTDLLFQEQRANGKSRGIAYLEFQSNEQSAKAKRLFEQTEKLPQRPNVSFVPPNEVGNPFWQDDEQHHSSSSRHGAYSSNHASRLSASASSTQYRPRGGGYHARPSSGGGYRPSSSSSYGSRSQDAEGTFLFAVLHCWLALNKSIYRPSRQQLWQQKQWRWRLQTRVRQRCATAFVWREAGAPAIQSKLLDPSSFTLYE